MHTRFKSETTILRVEVGRSAGAAFLDIKPNILDHSSTPKTDIETFFTRQYLTLDRSPQLTD